MKKSILIVSNPGSSSASNYCEGVLVDVKKFKFYFQELYGGAWNESEITCLNQPKKDLLEYNLGRMEDDYFSIVIFTGHGYTDWSNHLQLEIAPDVDYPAKKLIHNGRITVFDCCMVVWPEIKPKKDIIQKFATNEAMQMIDRNTVRDLYDEQIRNCGKQTIALCSCSRGEYSYASSEDGSNYSRSLIEAGERWHRKYSGGESFLDILSAHNMAKNNIDVSEGLQTPQIMCAPKGGKGVIYYPFAVNLKCGDCPGYAG